MSHLWRCDRCGREETAGVNNTSVHQSVLRRVDALDVEGLAADICRECFIDVKTFMTTKVKR
jgi:hypothetical protein